MTIGALTKFLVFTEKTANKLLKYKDCKAVNIRSTWLFKNGKTNNPPHHKKEEAKANILIVDDDELIRSLFKETLELEGYTAVTAASGAEGIGYLKQCDFDLVFLDLKMPEIDGADLFKWIISYKPNQRVIVITGDPGSNVMVRALEEGLFRVMDKPFDASDIKAAVNSFVNAS